MTIPYTVDVYNCVLVQTDTFKDKDLADFDGLLPGSIKLFREKGYRAVTATVTKAHISIVPSLINNGFAFHHARNESCCLILWMAEGPCQIPNYPFTSVGVGAFIVDDEDELLLVKEMVGPLVGWKMPSGYVEPNESLSDAIKRELKEETSLQDVTVKGILLYRHQLRYKWENTGDIFFVLLVAAKRAKEEAKPCLQEIAEISWIPVSQIATGQFEVECVTECWEVIKASARTYLKFKDGKAPLFTAVSGGPGADIYCAS